MTAIDVTEAGRAAATRVDPQVEAIAAALRARGAHRTEHGRWSLLAHLLETCRVLERWRQPAHVCLAGLVHSVYSTDVFADRLFGVHERQLLRDLAGDDAERLAFAFCSIDRRELFRALRERRASEQTALTLPSRHGHAGWALSPADIGALLIVHMANEVEQGARRDGDPDVWMAHVSQLGAWARTYAGVPPPVFAGCTVRVRRDDESALLRAYAAVTRAGAGVRRSAVERLDAAVRRVPWVGEPLIVLAFASLTSGDAVRAASLAAQGLECLVTLGTAWDKRLSFARWTRLATFVARACAADPSDRAFVHARLRAALDTVGLSPLRIGAYLDSAGALDDPAEEARVGPRSVISPARIASPAAARGLPPRFAEYVAGFRDNADRPRMTYYPGLSSRPFHDPSGLPLARDLERNAPAIVKELRALDGGSFHREGEPIGRTGSWDVFMLHERGRRRDENCDRCPVTAGVVESHRTVRTLAGLIYVSKLAAKSRVAPHNGPTNMRLRCHLGVRVPRDCGISVGGIVTTWDEGRCIVFDDSFEHAVWNDSDDERTVLIVDVWHPDLSDEEVALLSGFHRYAADHGANLSAYWRDNLTARQRVATME